MRPRVVSLAVVSSLLLVLPAAAEVYTIKLSNGTTFESRYQPKQAAWDPTMVTFVDETGTEISLPQALVSDVSAQSEIKGYGKVINTSTIDLGFMPNDLDESLKLMQQQAQQMSPFEQLMTRSYNQQQFVDPSAVGGGIPVGFGGYSGFNTGAPAGGGTFTPPTGTGTPAPFTTPTNTVTPAPFTIPSPGAATPPSGGQQ